MQAAILSVMHVLHPHTRSQLSANDLDFIKKTLATRQQDLKWIDDLLFDPACLDQILDDEALTQALLGHQGSLQVSHHLFFYTLVRYALRRQKVFDREVADYVASLLSDRLSKKAPHSVEYPQFYISDFMNLLQNADPYQSFQLTLDLANQSLFITGLFQEYLESRAQHHAAPCPRFYEKIGQAQFMTAGHHVLAHEHNLSTLYKTISKEFLKITKALNYFSQNMVFLAH